MVDLVVSKEGQKWRNRGLNSVPVAHTWEPVGRAATGSLYLSAYVEEKVQGSETDSMWGTLAEKVPVTDAFTGKHKYIEVRTLSMYYFVYQSHATSALHRERITGVAPEADASKQASYTSTV